jgi:type IV pilus assembly protein PilE
MRPGMGVGPRTAESFEVRNKVTGFTLIELMIVIVVVAVLAAIAMPSYRQYVLRTHRTEAKRTLLNVAVAQEKFYLQNNTYAGPSALEIAPPGGLGIAGTTERGHYAVAITAGSVSAFSATATAQGAQADDTRCASFTIDQAGTRTATNTNCWD